ncbi:Uncharacterised protein [Mycobacteroides abscessus subsp. massiliense]|nr:Uncharacterised protein [Mycobacteroides abscessus subsp. massiliense]
MLADHCPFRDDVAGREADNVAAGVDVHHALQVVTDPHLQDRRDH